MAVSQSSATAGVVQQSFLKRMSKNRKVGAGYVMLAPFVILFAVFVLWPIANSFYLSFTDYNGIKTPELVGTKNYERMWGDARFIKAMTNTFTYVFFIVLLNSICGLTLAMALRAPTLLNQICRALFFLPAVTSSIAVTVLWRTIFTSADYGLANTLLKFLGIQPIVFFSSPEWSIPILIIISLWGGMGGTMIIFLAGLQSISSDMTEAAAIDGANSRQRFLFITLPLLKPTTIYIVITGLIGAFQVFDMVYLIYSSAGNIGGPLDSALTIVPYLYDRGFTRFELGYASSIAWVLFAIIFVMTLINLRLGREDK